MSVYNINLILKYLKDNKLSKTKFCQKCHIGVQTFDRIMAGDVTLNLRNFVKIAKQLNIELRYLFKSF